MTETAVLVIDMLNTYQHADADVLAPNVGEIVDPLAGLDRDGRANATTST